jgi:hypothetical protein
LAASSAAQGREADGMKSTAQLLNEMLVNEARKAALVRMNETKKGSSIDLYGRADGTPYAIDWKRINTHEKLLRWIYHLIKKDWVTKDHVEMLLYVWANQFHRGNKDASDTLIGPL